MKTAAKVFIIIAMVLTFFLIFPLVIGILAIKRINSAESKDELLALGIVTLLFCSLLGGVFMLCIRDEDLNGGYVKSDNANGNALLRLKQLYDEGTISKEVYEEKRKKYLEDI